MFVFINVCHSAEASAILVICFIKLNICLDNGTVRENSAIILSLTDDGELKPKQ